MKLARIIALIALLSCGIAGNAQTANAQTKAQPAPNPLFEKMKTLVGEWAGKGAEGTMITNAFRLTSAGSVLMETTNVAGEGEMITMYHADGGDVIATHYCIARNQPRYRLRATSDPNAIALEFKDATNLATPASGHMHSGVYHFLDANHYSAEMVWLENGKERKESMSFERKN